MRQAIELSRQESMDSKKISDQEELELIAAIKASQDELEKEINEKKQVSDDKKAKLEAKRLQLRKLQEERQL